MPTKNDKSNVFLQKNIAYKSSLFGERDFLFPRQKRFSCVFFQQFPIEKQIKQDTPELISV